MTSAKILTATWNLETRQNLVYKLHMEWQWGQWQAYREHEPFTEQDVIALVRHLTAQIKIGKRNPGCLRFSTLIGQPEIFDEELSLMNQMKGSPRNRPKTEREKVLASTWHTDKKPDALPAVKTPDQVLAASEKWQKAGELLAKWKRENLT